MEYDINKICDINNNIIKSKDESYILTEYIIYYIDVVYKDINHICYDNIKIKVISIDLQKHLINYKNAICELLEINEIKINKYNEILKYITNAKIAKCKKFELLENICYITDYRNNNSIIIDNTYITSKKETILSSKYLKYYLDYYFRYYPHKSLKSILIPILDIVFQYNIIFTYEKYNNEIEKTKTESQSLILSLEDMMFNFINT